MIEMIWIAAFGFNVVLVPEDTKFKDMAACERFGREMAPRTADYTRGVFKLDWNVNVQIEFHCAVGGTPA